MSTATAPMVPLAPSSSQSIPSHSPSISLIEPMAPTMAIALSDWIRRARLSLPKDQYIECAISVALELTNRLCLVVGTNAFAQLNHASFNSSFSSWNESTHFDFDFNASSSEEKKSCGGGGLSSSLLLVQIDDIVTENVLVSVANIPNTPNNSISSAHFMAVEVSISQQESKPNSDIFETPQLTQRNVCFALGSILFELFSQGDPLVLIDLGTTDDEYSSGSLGSLLLGDIDLSIDENDDTTQPALKRPHTISAPTSNTTALNKSMRAKMHLQEQGLPLSICQLVSDLLEAEEGNQYISNHALLSLEDTQFDLMRMKTSPQRFLHDHTCPKSAWESTALFNQIDGVLYGMEKEMSVLMDAAARVARHVPSPSGSICATDGKRPGVIQMNNFLCEATFLSGHAGSGKTKLIRQLVVSIKDDWFVLLCKFDRQVAPLAPLLQSFDNFFGKFIPILGNDGCYLPRDHSMQETFDRISQTIIESIDTESFGQICELVPNLCVLFPMSMYHVQRNKMQNGTAEDLLASFVGQAGSGFNRLKYLLHIIFKAVCSGGHPVCIILEDLQWSDSFTMDIIGDLIQTAGCSSAFSSREESPPVGLLLAGTFRDHEAGADGFLMNQLENLEQLNKNIKVNRVCVGELMKQEINKMISFKLCLPMRHTRGLAQLVHHKTRGNPLYTIEFLRSAIQRNMILFSVKARRWTWDDTVIDIQMISDGVAELLTRKLRLLPHDVIETLKVASCFGQINTTIINLLDLGQFVPDMPRALELAVKEGIMEKAGPLFAFSHDMLQETTYSLIADLDKKKQLHKRIGMSLAQDPEVHDNAELCTLAVDQINMCKDKEGILAPVEKALFARLNLAAGRHSIAGSSYEQARGYFEAGISLLRANNWDRQYSLSLELYEMSVVVSFMDGKIETVSRQLDVILSNAKSFDDTMNSRALRSKLLASQGHHAEATSELLDILSSLGEEFPKEPCLSHVTSDIESTRRILKDITKEKILNLPKMKDVRKINAMRFMGLLIPLGHSFSPMLLPLLCCRMIKLTHTFGFCENSIGGLAFMSHALIHYSDDVQLASQIGRIAESLVSGNRNEHSLRARLTQMTTTVKCFCEPFQAIVEYCLSGYHSAKIVGDVDNALLCGMLYCVAYIFSIPDLIELQRHIVNFSHQLTKHKRIGVLHSLMSYFDAVTALIGSPGTCSIDARVEMKNNDELYEIAKQTQNSFLMHHIIINQMYVHSYCRDHLSCVHWAEKYRMHTGKKAGAKRTLDFYFCFFEGISALCLARDTKQDKWRKIGESSVNTMSQLALHSTWNFENKLSLLQAELHYLNGYHAIAEVSYQESIVSAHKHRFFHEEALACELYGTYLIETKRILEGLKQLHISIEKYKSWGSFKKANDLWDFMELVG